LTGRPRLRANPRRLAACGRTEYFLAPDDHSGDQHHGGQAADPDGQVDQLEAARQDARDEQADRRHDHREDDAKANQELAPRNTTTWCAGLAEAALWAVSS